MNKIQLKSILTFIGFIIFQATVLFFHRLFLLKKMEPTFKEKVLYKYIPYSRQIINAIILAFTILSNFSILYSISTFITKVASKLIILIIAIEVYFKFIYDRIKINLSSLLGSPNPFLLLNDKIENN